LHFASESTDASDSRFALALRYFGDSRRFFFRALRVSRVSVI